MHAEFFQLMSESKRDSFYFQVTVKSADALPGAVVESKEAVFACQCAGVLECWSAGVLECWSSVKRRIGEVKAMFQN